jgi:long-chain acyl-CoA synthetase
MSSLLSTAFVSPRNPVGRGEPLFPDEPRTIPALLRYAAEKFDRSDALVFKTAGKWERISSQEIIDRGKLIALGLYSLGLRKEDRAAILSANSPDWTITDAGCQLAGVIDVPIYTTLAPESVAYILNDSAARVLFIDTREAYGRFAEVLAGCPGLEQVVIFEPDGDRVEGVMSLAELIERGRELNRLEPGRIVELEGAVNAEDVATLIYTSGTTGEPKGVMLTHTNIISNVIDACEKYEFAPNDVSLSVLPLSHIFERAAMYLYLFNGMSVHFAESIEKIPDNLQEVRPTIFIGVPRIFEKVYAKAKLKAAQSAGLREKIFDWAIETAKAYAMCGEKNETPSFALRVKHSIADGLVFAKLRDFFGGRLRYCITGGAALSDDIYLIFTGAGIPIMQGYGLTETSPVVSSNNPAWKKLGSSGKAIRNVQIRTAEDGEIEVTGPGVMLGYYNKPDATERAFTDDGWFRTGDIGEIDVEGFLRITDRKKELFKTSGGKYIAPAPIEQRIKASRFVSQAVLVGNERKFAAALIVPNFEMLRSYARLKNLELKTPADLVASPRIIDLIERQVAEATAGLARYETVKKVALLEKELSVEGGELTPTLKVKRRVVDEKYKHIIDRIYADAEKQSDSTGQ